MTLLERPIKRITRNKVHSRGKHRAFVVSLEPGDVVGVRLQGTRQTYRLSVEAIYHRAIMQHVARVERRAKELQKAGLKRRASALAKARKELESDLKVKEP